MPTKKLKYAELISQFPNCPPNNYKQVQMSAFRWVHSFEHENDFRPINLIKNPPQRLLDDSDKMCIAYGISLFESLDGACMKYKKLYNDRREHLRPIFISDMGECVADLSLLKFDGLANDPEQKNFGHFTFHEYENVNLKLRIKSTYNIFGTDGKFIS